MNFFFCLIWHPAYIDPGKELGSQAASLALGPLGWTPSSEAWVGWSSRHTITHLGDTHFSPPIPTFQQWVVGKNFGQGVSKKLLQGIRMNRTFIN